MKAQIQSPHPSLALFDCLEKPQYASPYVWHIVQMCVSVCVWLYCKMSAGSLSLHCISIPNPSDAAIPFKAVSGVAEVELLMVLEIKNKQKKYILKTDGMSLLNRTSELKKKHIEKMWRSSQDCWKKTATTQGEPLKLCLSFVTFDLPNCMIVIIIILRP